MDYAKISDLKLNPTAPLSTMVKKNLVNVVNEEFIQQNTVFNASADVEKEQILEQYKKGVGFAALKKEHDKAKQVVETAQKKVNDAEKKLQLKGLTTEGYQYAPCFYGHEDAEKREIKRACAKVEKLLATVEAKGPNTIRNKIVSRLWLADTAGEAMVILREVLGNGIIPSLTVKDVKAISYQGAQHGTSE